MKKFGVHRLIPLSTASASDPGDLPDWKFKMLVSLVKLLVRPSYDEIVNISRIVRESDLDWTIVRITTLNNNPTHGRIRGGWLGRGEVGMQISRADLEVFVLSESKNASSLQQMPVISNKSISISRITSPHPYPSPPQREGRDKGCG
jgi:NAD(P)H-binding